MLGIYWVNKYVFIIKRNVINISKLLQNKYYYHDYCFDIIFTQ